MNRRKWIFLLARTLSIFFTIAAPSLQAAAPASFHWSPPATPGINPIKVLIIDGCSNHDWKRTTQLVCGILQPTGLFELTVDTAPANVNDPAYAGWCPDFSRYQVVIQNYNNLQGGAPWPAPAREAFVQFVRNGGGVFILHSANNSFADWDEYNHIIGLGWRKKEYGTAIQIGPDESLIRIPPGQGGDTTHNPRQDRLIHLLGNDPIHAGMPRTWMTPLIEVYKYTRGPAENLTVLSWAEDPKSPTRWPIEWTVTYGKGRVYCSSFGHVWKDEVSPVDMRCAAFQTILVRALQWLAQQPVTFPIPRDFPTASATSLRPLPVLMN
jgi:type 1 glutamine amidotransferase